MINVTNIECFNNVKITRYNGVHMKKLKDGCLDA